MVVHDFPHYVVPDYQEKKTWVYFVISGSLYYLTWPPVYRRVTKVRVAKAG